MKFDYRLGTEATFFDWEQEGCDKAKAILKALEKSSDDGAEDETSKKPLK